MDFQKIVNFIDTTSDNKDLPKLVTKKWIEVYDQSEVNFNVNKEVRMKTSMLKSDLYDLSDAYFVVKGDITVTRKHLLLMTLMHLIITATNTANNNTFGDKNLIFKNIAPFINCISKINSIIIYNA